LFIPEKYIPHPNIFLTTTLLQKSYVHNIFGSLVTLELWKLEVCKFSNIAHLVCILFFFSCYFISKYIITCILIIINAILMSFRWMAECFIKIWLNEGHFSRTITQLLYIGQGYVKVKRSHIPAMASSHFKIIDNYLYSEFFMTPQHIYIICLWRNFIIKYMYSVVILEFDVQTVLSYLTI
jgi:hypothetical protein